MLAAFEQQPEEKRRKAIDDALRELRAAGGNQANAGGNSRAPLSPELEAKVRTIGLQTFYSQSSAQTKADSTPSSSWRTRTRPRRAQRQESVFS
jgi:hypothetical protein